VKKIVAVIVWWLLLPVSCKESEPPPATLSLRAEDASCTEAWLKATTTEVPATVRLLRDGQRVSNLRLLRADSLLLDEGLLPRRTYTYQLQKLNADSSVVETSASVQLTTMDTTSHNFTWQIDTLGVTSSVLYDVAIISDTLAYAVGEMYLRDSTGQIDPQAWNAAKWNGQRWELLRIQFYTFCGQSGTGSYPAKAVFAFSPQEVWIAMGGSQVVRWNGQSQSAPMCTPVSINKLWGESPSSVYAVGNGGGIAHYNGSTWQRLESGTTLPLQDVLGSYNRSSTQYEILAVGPGPFNVQRKIVRISAGGVTALSDSGIAFSLNGVWLDAGRRYYVVGSGIFEKNIFSNSRWKSIQPQVTEYYTYAIRGTSLNHVVVVGAFRDVGHFNGWTWRTYPNVIGSGSWFSVSVRGKKVIAVGAMASQAIVLRGQFN
jgi:hypothetical protein